MRFFELVLLISITILPFCWKFLARKFNSYYLIAGLIVLILLQLVIEGYRWQLIPAYVLTLILVVRIRFANAENPFRFSVLSVSRSLGFLILLVPAWLLPLVLPVFELPEPRGPFSVGTNDIHLKTNRPEPITENPDDKRELMLKVWYPALAVDTPSETYVPGAGRDAFALKYGLPASALNYLDYVKTYAHPKAPFAEGRFPVLIFSHGYGSKATGYYALLSEIASRGYIVINMNHTYESLGTTFPDGSEVYFDYAWQQQIAADQMQTITPIQEAFRDSLSFDQRQKIVRDAVQDYFEGDIQERWVKDMQDVLDRLPQWNNTGFLKNKLNLEQIGVFGHSVGGGAAGRLSLFDSRIKAGANLDGIQWGTKIDTVFQKPFLYISADWPAEHEDLNAHIYNKKSTDYFYEAKLLNSGHPNFMDIPFMVPVPALAGTGSIDAEEGIEIVTDLVTRFFDFHLKKKPEANLQDFAKSSLLEFRVFKGDSI
ncbi:MULTISPECIES: hypothetical protein [unclassified Leeuwenhoekiella]|uniref:alpha/beta hydrolase family protein n=1 Tax=unclassified Leeuwenhoekiella TaxID=2615029 RepID=UPI000C64362D|nr:MULTISPECIES: hypothetical protein [unclassified Leeuwenhoekiella]MAW94095.1 hypothetical protein [Leeuwenhoekiella sp.]MBA80866.1 hypothetical protein [Leeuwenhoekiella sp.]|tara:strand:+ start:1474 stop:2928 length:1455 start_codon:yes stop_codon:yes gene_type:complete